MAMERLSSQRQRAGSESGERWGREGSRGREDGEAGEDGGDGGDEEAEHFVLGGREAEDDDIPWDQATPAATKAL